MPTEFVLGSVLHSELADFFLNGARFRKKAVQAAVEDHYGFSGLPEQAFYKILLPVAGLHGSVTGSVLRCAGYPFVCLAPLFSSVEVKVLLSLPKSKFVRVNCHNLKCAKNASIIRQCLLCDDRNCCVSHFSENKKMCIFGKISREFHFV